MWSIALTREGRNGSVVLLESRHWYPYPVSEKMALHARWRLVELLQVLGQRNTLNQPLLIIAVTTAINMCARGEVSLLLWGN